MDGVYKFSFVRVLCEHSFSSIELLALLLNPKNVHLNVMITSMRVNLNSFDQFFDIFVFVRNFACVINSKGLVERASNSFGLEVLSSEFRFLQRRRAPASLILILSEMLCDRYWSSGLGKFLLLSG